MRYMKLFVLAMLVVALGGFAAAKIAAAQGSDAPFGGSLDRPVSTWDAKQTEGDVNGDNDGEKEEDPPDDGEEGGGTEIFGEEVPGGKILLVLDASGSMYAGYNPGYPVYNGNGGVISYPNRWQTTQSEGASAVNGLDEDAKFDIIVYDTYVRACFGALTKAEPPAKANAVSWLYSCQATGCTNSYDALALAFGNYGAGLDTIMFMSDGYPNTALSRGIGACSGWYNVESMILNEVPGWIAAQVAANPTFKFMVIQIGGSPMPFMTQLGGLQNSVFSQK